jgi:hypothetical protein
VLADALRRVAARFALAVRLQMPGPWPGDVCQTAWISMTARVLLTR